MPPVKFDRIVSCSSEDSAFPAKNILTRNESNRKWKCKVPGEDQISVIIQLVQPYVITGIDIGNEGSAFVEVLVSRTSSPDDFQVLLVMSSFMTPMDSRGETNKNRVRMFSSEQLSETVKKEKWDRIKVLCTQPFNKHFQYGLSFLVLHSTDSKQEAPPKGASPVKTLGRFALKDDEDAGISVGSFFSRRKDFQTSPAPPATPLSGAAAVRDASSPANLACQKAANKRKGSDELTDSQKKKRGRPKQSHDDMKNETAKSPLRPSKDKTQKNGDAIKKIEKSEDSKNRTDEKNPATKAQSSSNKTKDPKPRGSSSTDNSGWPSSSQGSPQHTPKNITQSFGNKGNITYKPFNKLFEGVEVVISGYQNPGRSQVRDKALAMGARYQQNWSSSSTHLICAFPNTPKLLEAKGKGVIVTRDWVDDCYQERKRLAWRRYATEIGERKGASSEAEPEVWELIPGMDTSNNATVPPVSRRNNVATKDTRLGSDSEDSEDEIQRIRAKQILKKRKIEDDSHNDIKTVQNITKLKNNDGTDEAYDGSTDIDSEEDTKRRLTKWSEEKKVKYKDNLPSLPNLFNQKTFCLSHDVPENERLSLSRYIIAYGGQVLESSSKSANYIISRKKQKLSEGGRSVCAMPEWIWACNDQQSLVSPSSYKPA